MTICQYCKNKGFNKEEYKTFKNNINEIAKAIRLQLKYCGGMYYSTNNIIKWNADSNIKYFIIQELKKLGLEFRNNDTEYRVVE